MKCNKCGVENTKADVFCKSCGNKLEVKDSKKCVKYLKKFISWFKSLKGWKKIVSRIVMLIVIVFICACLVSIIFFLNSSIEKSKLKRYLSSVGYNCDSDWCYRNIEDSKEKIWLSNGFDAFHVYMSYDIEVENNYAVSINSFYYQKNINASGNIVYGYYFINNEEFGCAYIPEYYIGDSDNLTYSKREEIQNSFVKTHSIWHINDKSFKIDNSCERDISNYVDKALREFESYYKATGVRLQSFLPLYFL